MKGIGLTAKRLVAFLLSTIMVLSVIHIGTITVFANEFDDELFFSEVSRLITDNWDDGFIESVVFTINDPYMVVDGVRSEIDPGVGTSPVIVGGRTLIPIRALVEEIGGSVSFEPVEQRIIIDDDQTIEFQIGSTAMYVDGDLLHIDAAPVIINNRTMMPLRAVTENLGFELDWDPVTQEITLTRDFQTRRLIVSTTGTVDFYQLGATHIVRGGPDNVTVLQFNTIHEAQAAHDILYEHTNVYWVQPDMYFVFEQPVETDASAEMNLNIENVANQSWSVGRVGTARYADFLRNNGRNRRVVVAVLDTGVDANHPFLSGRVLPGLCVVTNSSNPYDWLQSRNGHGTPSAGVIVANTPNLNVQILPVRLLDNGTHGFHATSLQFSQGIRWAAARSDIINMSLSQTG